MAKEMTVFFKDLPLRKVFIDGEWWISAVDTAKAIGYSNPSREATRTIERNKERFKGYTTIALMANVENGIIKKRKTLMLNLKGVIALCMLSKLPNAIPFQRWADQVLADHIKEKKSRKQIYGELTDDSVVARKLEIAQWKKHGAKSSSDYSKLTRKEYELLFGDEEKKKKEMSGEELIKLMISNFANALQLMKKAQRIGVQGIEDQLYKTDEIIKKLD